MKLGSKNNSMLIQVSTWLFLGLLAYMPLHIFISTWIGSSFGALNITKNAKEVVLFIGASISLFAALRQKILADIFKDKTISLITGFVALNLILAVFLDTNIEAEILGLVYNIRFLVFFVWAILLVKTTGSKTLVKKAVNIVLISGMVTVVFGLVQYLFLPDNALRHVGYVRENGVLPAFFIDDKPDLERIMSTVRDPNSFGSYLIIILSLLSAFLLFTKNKTPASKKQKIYIFSFTAAAILALFWTFSRSAWIGFVASLVVLAIVMVSKKQNIFLKYRKQVIFGVLSAVVLIAGFLDFSWNSYWVQNVIFHADQATILEDPNELRMRFWKESVEEIADKPLGTGPGTAGLASIRNDKKTVLNENYYLQTAQEAGLSGLILFLAIIILLAVRLWRHAQADWLSAALLASLAGLTITNFLVHIWANEAVAYTWWGLAGLSIINQLPLSTVKHKRRTLQG